jgi:hypothetical protein
MLKKRWFAVTLLVLVVLFCVVFALVNATTRAALLALAAFLNAHDAAVTAFGTVVIAAFTATIWLISRRQLKHARDVDRAYVSGGGPGNPPTGPFVLCINNYGRTPATLIAFAVETCEFNAIPARPAYLGAGYNRTRVTSHIYPPGTHGREIARFSYNLQDPVAYGRFWYEDVWRRPHYASFILALPPRELPANVSPAFTDWT